MKLISSTLLALLVSASLLGSGMEAISQVKTKHPTPTKKAKKSAAIRFKAHCGMTYSAEETKKYHYTCPMDHKPLVKINK